jgi:hypothetical protein
VKVHFGEGLATHTGPEPCVGVREGDGEASAGECTGQPLSREIVMAPGADVVRKTEGNTHEHAIASARTTRLSQTLACADAPCTGTGRSHARPNVADATCGPHREGEEP